MLWTLQGRLTVPNDFPGDLGDAFVLVSGDS